jgi:hypothetical protein
MVCRNFKELSYPAIWQRCPQATKGLRRIVADSVHVADELSGSSMHIPLSNPEIEFIKLLALFTGELPRGHLCAARTGQEEQGNY